MDMLRRIRFLPATSLLIALGSSLIWAEAGILVVHVEDTQHHPIRGVQIGVLGNGGTAVTLDDGKARIALAPQTKEKSWVSLQILQTPPGKDFVMVSPWDYRVLVPSFQNEADNFVPVVVVQRGDRSALENGNFLIALAAKINRGLLRATRAVLRGTWKRLPGSMEFRQETSTSVSASGETKPLIPMKLG